MEHTVRHDENSLGLFDSFGCRLDQVPEQPPDYLEAPLAVVTPFGLAVQLALEALQLLLEDPLADFHTAPDFDLGGGCHHRLQCRLEGVVRLFPGLAPGKSLGEAQPDPAEQPEYGSGSLTSRISTR